MGRSSRCSSCNKKKEDCKCSKKDKEIQKVRTNCFIETHNFNSQVSQPCNGSSTVVFENVTNNHNKTRIEAVSTTLPPCTAILIIETRDGGPPIERVLTRQELFSIEVEDISRISVRCQGNPTGFCTVNIFVSKTFCICCPKDPGSSCCLSCNKGNKNCNCKEKQEVETTCFIGTHSPPNSFYTQPCNGSSIVAFEDLTNNHNKTLIQATSFSPPPCTAILIIETRDGGSPIERILPFSENPPTQFTIEVENVKRISVRCQGNPTGFCQVLIGIQKTFCICCPKDPISHSCFNC
jgi:hypothetical protein